MLDGQVVSEERTKLATEVIGDGRILVSYRPERPGIQKLPSPAEAAKDPAYDSNSKEGNICLKINKSVVFGFLKLYMS